MRSASVYFLSVVSLTNPSEILVLITYNYEFKMHSASSHRHNVQIIFHNICELESLCVLIKCGDSILIKCYSSFLVILSDFV
jgi:hypothetical protein